MQSLRKLRRNAETHRKVMGGGVPSGESWKDCGHKSRLRVWRGVGGRGGVSGQSKDPRLTGVPVKKSECNRFEVSQ